MPKRVAYFCDAPERSLGPSKSLSDACDSESDVESVCDDQDLSPTLQRAKRALRAQGLDLQFYDLDSDQEEHLARYQKEHEIAEEEQQESNELCRAVPNLLPPRPATERPISDELVAAVLDHSISLLESTSFFGQMDQQ